VHSTAPDGCVYVYFPIYDEELPPLSRLDALGTLARRSSAAATACCRIAAWDSTAPRWWPHDPAQARHAGAGDRAAHPRPAARRAVHDVFAGYLHAL